MKRIKFKFHNFQSSFYMVLYCVKFYVRITKTNLIFQDRKSPPKSSRFFWDILGSSRWCPNIPVPKYFLRRNFFYPRKNIPLGTNDTIPKGVSQRRRIIFPTTGPTSTVYKRPLLVLERTLLSTCDQLLQQLGTLTAAVRCWEVWRRHRAKPSLTST